MNDRTEPLPNVGAESVLEVRQLCVSRPHSRRGISAGTRSKVRLNWTQLSVANWWTLKERFRFQSRLDGNNFFPKKQPKYANPAATFNVNDPAAFGRGPGTQGSFSDAGSSNSDALLVGRFQF